MVNFIRSSVRGTPAEDPCMDVPRKIRAWMFHGRSVHGCSTEDPCMDVPRKIRAWMFRGTSMHGSAMDVPHTEHRGRPAHEQNFLGYFPVNNLQTPPSRPRLFDRNLVFAGFGC